MKTETRATKVRIARSRFGVIPSTMVSSVLFQENHEPESRWTHGIFQATGADPVFIPSSIKGCKR